MGLWVETEHGNLLVCWLVVDKGHKQGSQDDKYDNQAG